MNIKMNTRELVSWSQILADEKQKDYFKSVYTFSVSERAKGMVVYPAPDAVFRAFTETLFEDVKVVILGQDPYHGPGQAEGLSFSVPLGVSVPPSLRNIYKELVADTGCGTPVSGHLGAWAQQGVLLLNSVLTVEAGQASSHAGRGWEVFTDAVIQLVSQHKEHVVFILWGNYAKKKIPLIDISKHVILIAAHPSPLSAYSGFFGCKHFSKTNEQLRGWGYEEIDWKIE